MRYNDIGESDIMINEKSRNVIVGLTIIAAVALVIWGAFLLGRLPAIGPNAPYEVTVLSPSAENLNNGDVITFNGVTIGTVSSVALSDDLSSAKIVIGIYKDVNLPANIQVTIGADNLGRPYMSLYTSSSSSGQVLDKNGSAVLHAQLAPTGFIPQSIVDDIGSLKGQFVTLSGKLDLVADDLHVMLKPVNTTQPAGPGENQTAADMNNVSALIQRLNSTVNSLNNLLTDPKLQSQVREIIGNVDESSKELKTTLAGLSVTAQKFNATADAAHQSIASLSVQLTQILDKVNDIAGSIQQGQGTAGMLVKDPRLYNALLDVTQELKGTINDLHALVKQIQDQGFDMHLGF
ncbi:MAG TPA: MlaD family protein [Phycisphaerae bacterium]|nr:MlaD family protein [Phycisphaerae bacterium]